MNNTSSVSVPYAWLKTLAPTLLELDEVPLFGNTPHFPWEQFSSFFSTYFEVNELSIEPGELRWRTHEELFIGLEENLDPVNISVSALDGNVTWLMGQRDISLAMSALLTKNMDPTLQVIDLDLQEGFYEFLAIEAIHILSQIEFDKTLTPHILKDKALPSGPALCLDVKISLYQHTLWGRLVISPDFRRSWKEHYAERKLTTQLSQALAQKLSVVLNLEAGKTQLTLDEWKQISPGDFVMLDQCSIEPGQEKGRVWITLNGALLFRARVKSGSLKILESPLLHEVQTAMENKFPENDDHENQIDENEQELEEFEEDDLDLEEDEEGLEEDLEEEFSEATENDLLDTAEVEGTEEAEEAKEQTIENPVSSKPTVSSKEIPVSLVIEIGRIQMSIQKLLDLQPGNLLELDVSPESGVDLVVNGKCVGKGELLRVGEALGVRILDLG